MLENPILNDRLSEIDLQLIHRELSNMKINLEEDNRPKVNQLILKFEKTESLVQLDLFLKLAKQEGLISNKSLAYTNGLLNNLSIGGLNLKGDKSIELVFVQRKEIDGKLSPENPAAIVDFETSFDKLKKIVSTAFRNKKIDHKKLVDFYHRHIFKKGVSEEKIISILGGDTRLDKSVLDRFNKPMRDKIWGELLSISIEQTSDELTINFAKDKDSLIEWAKASGLSQDEEKAFLIIIKQAQSKGWRRFFINPSSEEKLVFKPHHHQDYIKEASDLDDSQKKALVALRAVHDKPSSAWALVERAISARMTSLANGNAKEYADYALKDLGFLTTIDGGEETSMAMRVKTLIKDSKGSITVEGETYREEWMKYGVAGDYDNFTNHNSLQVAYSDGVGLVPLPGDVKIAIITTNLESCTRNIYYAIQNMQSEKNRALTLDEIETIYNDKMNATLAEIKQQIIKYESEVTGLSETEVAVNFKSWLKHSKPDETHLEVSGSFQCLYASDDIPISTILGKADSLMSSEKNQGHRGFHHFGAYSESRGQEIEEETPPEVIAKRKHIQDKSRGMPADNGHRDLNVELMARTEYLPGSLDIAEIDRIISSLPKDQSHEVFTIQISKLMKITNELLDHVGGDYKIKIEGSILKDFVELVKSEKFKGNVHVGYRFDPIVLITGTDKEVRRMKNRLQIYIKQHIVAEVFNAMAGAEDKYEIKKDFITLAKNLNLDESYIEAMQNLARENSIVKFKGMKDAAVRYYCFEKLWIDNSAQTEIYQETPIKQRRSN